MKTVEVADLILSEGKGLNVANCICMGGGENWKNMKRCFTIHPKDVMRNCIVKNDQENSNY